MVKCKIVALVWVLGFIISLPIYAQNVLIDDLNDPHTHSLNWTNQSDTLEVHGVTVHYTSIEGWTNIMDMNMVWIQSSQCTTRACTTYSASDKVLLQNYVSHGGRLLIGTTVHNEPPNNVINELLLDSGWETTMEMSPAHPPGILYESQCSLFTEFSPFTDGVNRIIVFTPQKISCGSHAYPFAFLETYEETTVAAAAISYPFLQEGNCSSYVMLVTGNHMWENGEAEEAMAETTGTYIFARNILLTMAGVPGYELAPGAIPGGGNVCDSMAEWEYNICNRYPNPFTPGEGSNKEVLFEYPNMGEKPATLYIYNVQNILVREISIPASYSASKDKARWDGRDDYGNPMRQGLYLYVIESEGQIICSGSVVLAR